MGGSLSYMQSRCIFLNFKSGFFWPGRNHALPRFHPPIRPGHRHLPRRRPEPVLHRQAGAFHPAQRLADQPCVITTDCIYRNQLISVYPKWQEASQASQGFAGRDWEGDFGIGYEPCPRCCLTAHGEGQTRCSQSKSASIGVHRRFQSS